MILLKLYHNKVLYQHILNPFSGQKHWNEWNASLWSRGVTETLEKSYSCRQKINIYITHLFSFTLFCFYKIKEIDEHALNSMQEQSAALQIDFKKFQSLNAWHLCYSWPLCHLIPSDSRSLPLIFSCRIVPPFTIHFSLSLYTFHHSRRSSQVDFLSFDLSHLHIGYVSCISLFSLL